MEFTTQHIEYMVFILGLLSEDIHEIKYMTIFKIFDESNLDVELELV